MKQIKLVMFLLFIHGLSYGEGQVGKTANKCTHQSGFPLIGNTTPNRKLIKAQQTEKIVSLRKSTH